MSKRKNTKYTSQREREELLENFLEDLDNEDEEDIFENTNLDSDSDTDIDMAELDPIGKEDLNETVDLYNDVDNVYNIDNDTNNVNSNTNKVEFI